MYLTSGSTTTFAGKIQTFGDNALLSWRLGADLEGEDCRPDRAWRVPAAHHFSEKRAGTASL